MTILATKMPLIRFIIRIMGPINGNDNYQPKDGDNIVAIPTLAERDRMRREKEKQNTPLPSREPLINMPPVTKILLGLMISIHLILTFVLSSTQSDYILMNYGFVPERFSPDSFTLTALPTLLTHMFLHGSWLHIIMNSFMLAAFGSGVERWLGSKRMLILFIASGLFGAAAHYILNTSSVYPMIGASGGLSGLFAAAIIMLNRGQKEMGGRFGILPFALLWIGLSIGFGMMGGPDGSLIAWAAHVGGFLGGFAVLKLMKA